MCRAEHSGEGRRNINNNGIDVLLVTHYRWAEVAQRQRGKKSNAVNTERESVGAPERAVSHSFSNITCSHRETLIIIAAAHGTNVRKRRLLFSKWVCIGGAKRFSGEHRAGFSFSEPAACVEWVGVTTRWLFSPNLSSCQIGANAVWNRWDYRRDWVFVQSELTAMRASSLKYVPLKAKRH
jgi:hypothetical protein